MPLLFGIIGAIPVFSARSAATSSAGRSGRAGRPGGIVDLELAAQLAAERAQARSGAGIARAVADAPDGTVQLHRAATRAGGPERAEGCRGVRARAGLPRQRRDRGLRTRRRPVRAGVREPAAGTGRRRHPREPAADRAFGRRARARVRAGSPARAVSESTRPASPTPDGAAARSAHSPDRSSS